MSVRFERPDWGAIRDSGDMAVDMHFHTSCSDSFTDVRAAVRLAAERGVGVAITDHNLIESLVRIKGEDTPVPVIPGMEVSTSDGPHILVYFYDLSDLERFWYRSIRPRLQECPWLALRDCPTERLLDLLEKENCVVSAFQYAIGAALAGENVVAISNSYHIGGYRRKPIYKLCCSAFAAADQHRLLTYRGRCYKWGYFTRVEKFDVETSWDVSTSNASGTPLMWCARYLMLKHPEQPLLMAARLKASGYRFTLDMYGSGEYEPAARRLAENLGVTDVVRFVGNKPNDELLADMRHHSIFLFTSDRNEGWGAVANESMANGCVLVASDAIGSSPYLIDDGNTGLLFKSPRTSSNIDKPDTASLDELCEKVKFLLDNPQELQRMRHASIAQMRSTWNPRVAAERLIALIDHLRDGDDTPFADGPCSKA